MTPFRRTTAMLVLAAALAWPLPGFALSELQPAGSPAAPDSPLIGPQLPGTMVPGTLVPSGAEVERAPLANPGVNSGAPLAEPAPVPVPLPEPIETVPGAKAPDVTGPVQNAPSGAAGVDDIPVLRDILLLPQPARLMRERIIEAARSGDTELLRPLLQTGEAATALASTPLDVDPIDYLSGLGGDSAGQEILAIMLDLLDSGFVLTERDDGQPVFVWPYFVARDIERLSAAEKVDLFRIVTAGDLEDMRSSGGYNFYRIGITPDGRWAFFMAGE